MCTMFKPLTSGSNKALFHDADEGVADQYLVGFCVFETAVDGHVSLFCYVSDLLCYGVGIH